MKSFCLEGYGCSLNVAQSESIDGLLRDNGFKRISDFAAADFVIINTCSVKQPTQQRMVWRIKFLLSKKKKRAKLIVSGCLAAAEHEALVAINPKIIVLDTNLSSLCTALKIKPREFSPEIVSVKSHEFISIIPASVGCLGACTYCSARLARKGLRSYPIKSIGSALKAALKGNKINSPSKEIWLTSQDLGCYGFDIASSLPVLIKELLKTKGEFRMRLGMMNPNHFMKIRGELMPLFEDKRLYKFLHLPLQSGSDKILKKMNRKYSAAEFVECINFAKGFFPEITIATDIIVGFPGETDTDFKKTLALLKEVKPDIVNISRFGKREGTKAWSMPLQVPAEVMKARSRELKAVCDGVFGQKNGEFLGKTVSCLVSEKTKNGFNARTDNYLTVFVKKGFGNFVKAKITGIRGHYLVGEVLQNFNVD